MLDLSKFPRFTGDARLAKRIGFLEIEWRRQCPDVDLEDQLGWAHYWVQTNPKGTTYSDMSRFLSNWFKLCQKNNLGGVSIKTPELPKVKHEENFQYDMTPEEMAEIRRKNMEPVKC